MLKRITSLAKHKPLSLIYCVSAIFMFVTFTILFSFYVLQADDYSYASYWKNGIGEFLRLTGEHFTQINGRALVHFFAQTVLSLPHFMGAFINSLILFFICFSSYRFIKPSTDFESCCIYTTLFYSFLCFVGLNAAKEALMWVSAFYNYVFPCLMVTLALYFTKKNKKLGCFFSLLSGATTEQWGITAFTMLFLLCWFEKKKTRKLSSLFMHFLPSVFALCGYLTIYLSPATRLRITQSGHASLQGSLFDLPRLGNAFFSQSSSITAIALFIAVMLLTAFLQKKKYAILHLGFLPLLLIVTSQIHKSYLSLLIVFLCYLVLCFAVFFSENQKEISIFIAGAFVSIFIMLPTNTFDARVTFPCVILLILASLITLFTIKDSIQKKLYLPGISAFFIAGIIFFTPNFIGFMKNSSIEHENLAAIKVAQKHGELHYNIDYDKNFVTKQMFNDGWFYSKFLSLYSIEDCTVFIESKNSVTLSSSKTKGLRYNGDVYIPMRAFLSEQGGTITTENGVIMTLNGKTLTMLDGILCYTPPSLATKYLIADDNRIINFYTLYLKLSVVNDAFGLDINPL